MGTDEKPEPVVSIDRLTHQLRELGINADDLIMVHASLRAVAPTEHRGEGLIEALDRAVGPNGTLLMVLGAEDAWAWVNDRPESERPALLGDATPFDAQTTPAQADVGTLAELFRTAPGTLVSDNPEGRFAARGRRAAELLADQPWDDYFGPGSPLERLVQWRGSILRLGADPNTVTAMHYAEYLLDLPNKRRVNRHRRVMTPEGPRIRRVECLDDSQGIVGYDAEDYFTAILRTFLETGNVARGTVGAAPSELIDAAALVDHAVQWMAENLR